MLGTSSGRTAASAAMKILPLSIPPSTPSPFSPCSFKLRTPDGVRLLRMLFRRPLARLMKNVKVFRVDVPYAEHARIEKKVLGGASAGKLENRTSTERSWRGVREGMVRGVAKAQSQVSRCASLCVTVFRSLGRSNPLFLSCACTRRF